jgi:hypothetical protein
VAGVRVIFCAVRAVHLCFFLGSEFDQDSPYPGTGVHNWLYGTALFAAIAEDLKQRGLCCIKS